MVVVFVVLEKLRIDIGQKCVDKAKIPIGQKRYSHCFFIKNHDWPGLQKIVCGKERYKIKYNYLCKLVFLRYFYT
ncbi:MAG: hypothetical protein BGP14_22185 [Sphingobacteriales bacterium 44-15]|nr:MAG: hypothetical protein BGP14_22185 [Sphingobacteriales bacterium 44-15]